MDFSLYGYRKLLLEFSNAGYELINFSGIKKTQSKPYVVLRHDVDIDLFAALEIAKIEYELGVTSTFFITLRSPFYNPLTIRSKEIVDNIKQLGHSVAAHIDLPSCNDDYTHALNDINILQSYYPYFDINFVSLHCPGSIAEKTELLLHSNIANVYSPILGNEVIYISDSGGSWKYGHPTAHSAFKGKKHIQFLTHPIWWTTEGDSPLEKLQNFVNQKSNIDYPEYRSFLPKFFKSLGQ